MRQADFAGTRRARTPADEPGVRNRVMRRAKRPLARAIRRRAATVPRRYGSAWSRWIPERSAAEECPRIVSRAWFYRSRADRSSTHCVRPLLPLRARAWPWSGPGLRENREDILREHSIARETKAWAGTCSGSLRYATTSERCRMPNTRTPSVTAASAALSAGTSRFGMPWRRAQTAIDNTPRTGRSEPSRESSPTSM